MLSPSITSDLNIIYLLKPADFDCFPDTFQLHLFVSLNEHDFIMIHALVLFTDFNFNVCFLQIQAVQTAEPFN